MSHVVASPDDFFHAIWSDVLSLRELEDLLLPIKEEDQGMRSEKRGSQNESWKISFLVSNIKNWQQGLRIKIWKIHVKDHQYLNVFDNVKNMKKPVCVWPDDLEDADLQYELHWQTLYRLHWRLDLSRELLTRTCPVVSISTEKAPVYDLEGAVQLPLADVSCVQPALPVHC